MLGNAIALNSSVVNVARIVGPTVAGFLIAAMGETVCFFINAASYGAVILSLFMMRGIRRRIRCREKSVVKSFREGFFYVFGTPQLRSVILLLGLVSLSGVPFLVLLPIFARDVLLGGPRTLGFLMGASGGGALCGALFLASRKGEAGLERVVALSAVLFGASLVSFAVSRILWLSIAMMFLAGVGMMVQMAASNTILQTFVEDDKRGRVMSFFIMAFFGMAPFGSLLAGELAGHYGAPETLMIGGLCCVLSAVVFAGSRRRFLEKASLA
jgi:MFS family permease